MYFKFDPLKTQYKSVIGGVAENKTLVLKVETNASCVTLVIAADGESERFINMPSCGDNCFFAELNLACGLYFYYFIADGACVFASDVLLPASDCGLECGTESGGLNCGTASDEFVAVKSEPCAQKKWQLTVYPADYRVPSDIFGGIIYQIFPDRFCKVGDFSVGEGKVKREDWGGEPTFRSADGKVRNNEFFGGNFKGIISKLGYLKALGVTAVYLNPIFKSYSSHRYDTGDYMQIDDVLGGNEAFDELLKAAKNADIKVIIDGVFNHVGAGSVYFNKYGDYDSLGAYNCQNSPYYSWFSFSEYPEKYDSWWGFKTLPSINKNSEEFQNFIAGEGGVLDKYLAAGVYGVRLDVADELTDCFIKKIRERLKKHGERFLIGEVWEDATNKIAYGVRRAYFYGGELDSVMNYPLKDAIINYAKTKNCALLYKTVREQINNYPPQALNALMNVLSTHDSLRLINALGRNSAVLNKDLMANNYLTQAEYKRGKKLLEICYALSYFLYGVPSLYYGDEAGLQGDLDPYNRRCYNWESADNGLIAGFMRLGGVRSRVPQLKNGRCEVVAADKGFFAFKRINENGELLFCCNLNGFTQIVTLTDSMKNELSGKQASKFEIPPESFTILTREF